MTYKPSTLLQTRSVKCLYSSIKKVRTLFDRQGHVHYIYSFVDKTINMPKIFYSKGHYGTSTSLWTMLINVVYSRQGLYLSMSSTFLRTIQSAVLSSIDKIRKCIRSNELGLYITFYWPCKCPFHLNIWTPLYVREATHLDKNVQYTVYSSNARSSTTFCLYI
jgi:hypothetical protein